MFGITFDPVVTTGNLLQGGAVVAGGVVFLWRVCRKFDRIIDDVAGLRTDVTGLRTDVARQHDEHREDMKEQSRRIDGMLQRSTEGR